MDAKLGSQMLYSSGGHIRKIAQERSEKSHRAQRLGSERSLIPLGRLYYLGAVWNASDADTHRDLAKRIFQPLNARAAERYL
jgi:hypothetical protein